MLKSLKAKDEVIAYFVLLHTGSETRKYIGELFEIAAAFLTDALNAQISLQQKERHAEDYFLLELLENPDMKKETILERLEYIKIPYNSHFLLCCIHSTIRRNSAEAYFIRSLRYALPDCNIFTYEQNILILLPLSETAAADYQNYIQKRFHSLEETLLEHHSQLCICRPFHRIDQFFAAYQQTKSSWELSQLLNQSELYIFFEQYLLEDLFYQNCSKDLFYSYCNPDILNMVLGKNEKQNYQLRILEVYLKNERKLTETAQELNMHRNNVHYHITQLEKKYCFKLDDPETRLKLLLSFKLLRHPALCNCSNTYPFTEEYSLE